MKRSLRGSLLVALSATGMASASAQALPEPMNVVQISASAQQEAVQDWLTVTLMARHQANEAAGVQNRLKTVLDLALRRVRAESSDKDLQASTGGFTVQPRFGKEGQIVGWQGSAELVLQGRDVARILRVAAGLEDMSVAQMAFSLSPEASQALERDLRQQAIARFRQSATDVAQGFGFSQWRLREATVQFGGDAPHLPRPVMLRAVPLGEAAPALPAQPGRSAVQVSVSGSVQLQ